MKHADWEESPKDGAEPSIEPQPERLPASARRVVICVNPKAGPRASAARVDQLVAALAGQGLEVEVFDDLQRACETARRDHEQTVLRALVAVGGDGTAAAVANRTPEGLPIALMPGGNENLLARYLDLDLSPEALAEVIAEGLTVRLDAGPGGWTATDGVHLLTCVLDDINRLPGENKSNNVVDRTILVGPAPKGLLNGSSEAAPGSVNLTTEGTLDWVLWGVGRKDGLVRKANAKLIDAALEKTGEGYCDATVGCPVGMNWSDGEPTAEGANSHAGLWWNGVGTGHAFSVPADTTERALRVYVAGIEGAAGALTARLSDDSAPPYVSTRDGNAAFPWAAAPGSFATVYTIRYRAASPGQRLTVEWKLTGEANPFIGQLRMQAATLAPAGTR